MFTFGVFASGGGSNFKAILSHANDGSLGGACRFLVTNNASCGAVKIAEEQGIPVFHISSKTHPDKRDYEKALLQVVQKFPVDFVALCGFMKRIPDSFLQTMENRILNVHPSLLPKYGGAGFFGIHVHEAVLAAKEKESGVTIHLVSSQYDSGRILAQVKVPVMPSDSPEELAKRVLVQEHLLFWKTLKDYAENFSSAK
ncbi:formyltetrahydrofolate-dependent phosphoribosylglycinamide formyltransferase [Fibrobacter intestinalis]|uniref:Phosphoribosylglycinamide formyltransferase n=1 Tax=Fibrobacter intestinalis TaxID=28122 RepID=A0A1M6YJJ0_9BACT|nr:MULTISPECIES: phosphoribosylglycinamide formyltransferase [Fibrobacter]MDD7299606.1 phosphoribosylglycinamide formyltransferase [Fibrobacter intestinalis]PBC67112.1 formyltetrahydrofolate-dependent phosphoribosylglycinamide formyltransferase [Fibrobacter sp. UWS1]SHL18242.1 formyltetrahydrofolate-dependent phosphoribosylglycinamide formyltransferase [Fibrobacter intestinalis]